MMKRFFTTLICSLLAAVICSVLMAFYFVPTTSLGAFIWVFVIFMLYISVPFIIGGFISVYVMRLAQKHVVFIKKHAYATNLLAYIVGGPIIAIFYTMTISTENIMKNAANHMEVFILAILCSLLFFHLYFFISKHTLHEA